MKKFIGIDGGGTKTMCVMGDETGKIEAVVTGKSSNIQSKPLHDVKKLLLELIEKLMTQTNTEPRQLQTIYLSLAGCGRSSDQKRVYEALRPHFMDSVSLIVESDAMGALAAGTWGEPGIVLIAGTGSIAYVGVPSGGLIRVGGWGYLLGDEGSGFDIGRKALAAVLKQHDGRGEPTLLTEYLLEELQLNSPEELISLVYNSDQMKEEIAALTKVVFKAAEKGDRVTKTIVDNAICELLQLVRTASDRSGEVGQLPLVINGGLFNDDYFRNQFVREMRSHVTDITVVCPTIPPATGVLILALQSSGLALTDEVKSNLKSSWEILSK
ncbi:MAG TPA: BadF/BadG/BcrA/BcrD ATPase family protein [Bacillales bacterium]|nr:BadF/BadG/BcrA/BcrD ATPase family protein [Bacillales bacterium]